MKITGSSKLFKSGECIQLSSLSTTEYQQFIITTKKTIAKALGKKVIRIIEK